MARRSINSERIFFTGASLWFVITTFLGFSYSFYLGKSPEPLPFHLIVHGWIFTSWILLFFIQTSLISVNRIDLHKSLGILGFCLILVMIPVGFYPILYKVSIGTKSIDHGGYNIFTLVLAYTFFFIGFRMRKSSFYHKRFMLFTTMVLTIAAIDRVAFIFYMENSQIFRKGMVFLPAIVLFVLDYCRLKYLVWLDLLPVMMILILFYFSDFFWFSPIGNWLMNLLIKFI